MPLPFLAKSALDFDGHHFRAVAVSESDDWLGVLVEEVRECRPLVGLEAARADVRVPNSVPLPPMRVDG